MLTTESQKQAPSSGQVQPSPLSSTRGKTLTNTMIRLGSISGTDQHGTLASDLLASKEDVLKEIMSMGETADDEFTELRRKSATNAALRKARPRGWVEWLPKNAKRLKHNIPQYQKKQHAGQPKLSIEGSREETEKPTRPQSAKVSTRPRSAGRTASSLAKMNPR